MLDYGLSSQQLDVICALSNGATMTVAAGQAGVHRNSITNWIRNLLPFQLALSHAQYARALYFREKMEELADRAAQTLSDILVNEKLPASVRLKAALAVLNTAGTPPLPKKQVEIDIEKIVTHRNAPPDINEEELAPPPPVHNSAQSAVAASGAGPRTSSPAVPQNLHKAAQSDRPAPKVGRNEPCPCGSGLKYKRCCLDKPLAKAA